MGALNYLASSLYDQVGGKNEGLYDAMMARAHIGGPELGPTCTPLIVE